VNQHLVQVVTTNFFCSVIADVANFEDSAFDLLLNAESELLNIRCCPIGIRHCERGLSVVRIVIREGSGYFVGWSRHGRQTGYLARKTGFGCSKRQAVVGYDVVTSRSDIPIVDVAHTVAGTQRGLAVPENVIGKSDTWCKVVSIFVVERLACGATGEVQ